MSTLERRVLKLEDRAIVLKALDLPDTVMDRAMRELPDGAIEAMAGSAEWWAGLSDGELMNIADGAMQPPRAVLEATDWPALNEALVELLAVAEAMA